MATTRADLRALLRGRDLRSLVAVRFLGQFCDGLVQAALATFVLFSPERQSTPAQVAVAFAILLMPYSLVGPFVGVFLDRWRRRSVLLWANVARAALIAVVAVVVATGRADLVLGAVVLVALGLNRFVLAAHSASIPRVTEQHLLVTANSLIPTGGTLAAVVGGGVGVGIRSITGGGDRGSVAVLLVAVAGVLLAGLAARRIPIDALGPDGDDPTVTGDRETVGAVMRGLREGLRHLHARPAAAWAIGVVVCHRVAFGMSFSLALLLTRNTIYPPDRSEDALAFFAILTGATGAGAFLGAVMTPGLVPRRVSGVRWSAAVLLLAAVVAPIGLLTQQRAGLLVAGAAIGLAGVGVKINGDTVVQRTVEDDHRGRVFAIYDVVLNVGLVSGIVAVAVAVPDSGVSTVVTIAVGVICAAAAAAYLQRARGVSNVGSAES